ncbi:kinase-like domain-containing protein [Vararia minispora EC-137]|uniref:Kinase-like domain-containing protein n=1 Tax=Vararia minispora EC-137 TaxID=1314806 RepID=A0ACB8QJM3_9AGAM|nr:kinase-like domain-containing protein [Vararia minispora EC-137]
MALQDADLTSVQEKLKARHLQVVEELGTGTFATVYRVVDCKNREFALKILFSSPDNAPTLRTRARMSVEEQFDTERQAHRVVSGHPNIVTLHDSFVVNGLYCLLLDLYSDGTLLEHASSTLRFWRSDAEIKRVFTQLIDAVGYCHSLGVAHRDLKPENIFVSADHTFAIGDFGLATSFSRGIASEAGSRPYKAPESFPGVSKDKYDTRAADVWALGIILINIICGFMPWNAAVEEESAFSLFCKDPYHLQTFLPLSSAAIPLFSRVLDPDPMERISLDGLRKEVQFFIALLAHFLSLM